MQLDFLIKIAFEYTSQFINQINRIERQISKRVRQQWETYTIARNLKGRWYDWRIVKVGGRRGHVTGRESGHCGRRGHGAGELEQQVLGAAGLVLGEHALVGLERHVVRLGDLLQVALDQVPRRRLNRHLIHHL